MGIAARCGLTLYQWSFYRYQHQPGRTSIVGLLFVNFYFFIFIQQQFRAGQAMNSTPAAIPVRRKL
ncbi:MAG: hypothetical protein H7339_02330 [Arcicella sp.]|nr:hypothetical protein [Arcicella sp.]